jgi:cytochrome c oxidase subunit 1
MSNESTIHVHEGSGVAHDDHHDGNGHHHHQQSFVTKYIFSQDHKTIAKQFLITGIMWAVIGALFSVLFRLQLGYPDETFPILESVFGNGQPADGSVLNFTMR